MLHRLITSPASVFLLLGTAFGLAYLVATPPLQTPDELRHLRRIVQIVNGGVMSGAAGPASLDRLASTLRNGTNENRKGSDGGAFPAANLVSAGAVVLEPGDTRFLPAGRYLAYSPVAYLPGVAAVAGATALGARPLGVLYLARFSLMLSGIALVYAAIRLSPALQWPLCLIALLPTACFLRSGITADTITTGFAFLLFALTMRSRASSNRIAVADVAILTAVGTALALCKIGYVPLTLAFLSVPADRFAAPRQRVRWTVLAVGVPFFASVLWLSSTTDGVAGDAHRRSDAGAQLQMILADPIRFVSVLEDTWLAPARLWQLAATFVGRVLALHVPSSLIAASLFAVAALMLVEGRSLRPLVVERLLLLGGVAACIVVVSLGLYLTWTAPGSTTVRGLQGRYLYPLAPFALLALVPPARVTWRAADVTAAAIVVAAAVGTNAWGIASVISRTWLGGA